MNEIKFFHMADLHLGSAAYDKLGTDGLTLLHDIVDAANDQNIDLILIAGDVFDTRPSKELLSRFDAILGAFRGRVFIIPGNHDYLNPLSQILRFSFSKNMTWFTTPEITNVYWAEKNVRIWGYAYHEQQVDTPVYNEAFDALSTDANERNILLAHGGDAAHIPTDYEALSEAGFDYVAFGHLHGYQTPAENIVYSGSLIPMNRTETGTHGYVSGMIDEDGNLRYELIDMGPKYVQLTVDVSPFRNVETLYRHLRTQLRDGETAVVTLSGERSFELALNLEHLYRAGNIERIIDATRLSIDYEALKRYNADNILGIFIDRMQLSSDPLAEKALQYGVAAFLEAREDEN